MLELSVTTDERLLSSTKGIEPGIC